MAERRLRVVCFDFDGTLAYMDPPHIQLYVIAAEKSGASIDVNALQRSLGDDVGGGLGGWGPWRTPDGVDHSAHSGSEAAFRALRVDLHLARFEAAGATGDLRDAAQRVANLEGAPRCFHRFDDAIPALEAVRAAGLEAVIVSNHVWDLPDIVEALGLHDLVVGVLTSARVGYRKPHPAIYEALFATTGAAPEEHLFVGDNRTADVEGPRRAGMHAVLLHREGASAGRHAAGEPGGDTIATLLDLPI